jgi:hypothetical protein
MAIRRSGCQAIRGRLIERILQMKGGDFGHTNPTFANFIFLIYKLGESLAEAYRRYSFFQRVNSYKKYCYE